MEIIHSEDNSEGQRGYLALPFSEGQFKDFVGGLLGKPQTITKHYSGRFEIYLSDIQNFHQLLHQRISQQNSGHLIQFVTTIYYSDDSSVTLGSIEELLTYNEIRKVYTRAVQLSWTYLIKFSDKDVPEKQVIDLFIATDNFADKFGFLKRKNSKERAYSANTFTVVISHTARTWGFDIIQLLSSNINSLFKDENSVKEWIKNKTDTITIISGLLFIIGSFTGIYLTSSKFVKERVAEAESVINDSVLATTDKINFLISQISSQGFFELKTIIYVAISLILSIVVMVQIGTKTSGLSSFSYIVMTKSDKESLDTHKANEKKQFYYLAGTFLAGIAINILSSLIYDYFTK